MNEYLELKSSSRKFNEEGGVIISPNDDEFFTFDEEKIEEEIDFLRKSAFSSEFDIDSKDLLNLGNLMVNLCQDPNNDDTIPHNQSSTASKQILMRWDIPMNGK